MSSNHAASSDSNIDNNVLTAPMEDIVSTSSVQNPPENETEIASRDSSKDTENDVHTQTPITDNFTIMDEDPKDTNTNKGKSPEVQTATQTNPPKSIEITVLKDIFKSTTQVCNKAHKGFIPRDSFKPNLINNEIINLLKTSFLNDSNAYKFEVNTTSTYRYFTIFFKTRDSLNQYIENSPENLKPIKIYELTNTAINVLIERKLSTMDQAVIKIMDIPYNYDTSMLIKHLALKTNSNVIDHKEIKKPPRKIPNRNNHGHPFLIKPAYKQLIVQFDKKSAYDYFMEENYWCLEIENFVVRILPGNQNDAEFKKRTSKYYKITGLPLNTTHMDLNPLIKHIYGRTCTFTQTTKSSTMKNAYIYVSPDNYPEDATGGASLDFEGHKIYTLPGHLAGKTCNICRSPLHATNVCDDKNFRTDNNNRKFFNKRFIDRKEEKITINETHKNRYNHVITLNSNKKNQQTKPPLNDYTRPQPTDRNTNSRPEVKARLEKYDTIIKQLSTNITLLSQKEIATASSSLPSRPHKQSKRNTPYEKTSYEATKSKYNLRGSKQSRISADESETCPTTEEDTDVPEESVMSDGAVFKDIITQHVITPPNDNNFTVRSYNPLNLISSFNGTR
ncbi:hypothetical protein GLOIN_2v1480128 [Rhizophagus irregularis DAOM 181602=DAOM 197198]|uniref:Uncharacterized protein n=3 Tax=Rhizophagus irregularis TaxID=588596 RepID=U9T1N9_RHIID|nr:hypothetical protein GLOIN_2v1480128 [Rhizophagus irregularis DAOM 181602=DAOM 197198]EXX74658.1 hypothetical protein RirG_049110 [Rhizophagus irregularis DAOM 197198w]POG69285.1 hypothetical protein GLOIN_2v1480128 [Rhizophagus irregularis DAOM 181602=DAOM 197198]|eukprot:XP_025176151.1 hypothetical protein GLOIN_2v1480128 [Rhizophagus irregularis DAOM 181602=DAOM 197198]